MTDIAKMENELSLNFNTEEAKIAKEVAVQFVAKRTGKTLKNTTLRRESEIMIMLVNELEPKQGKSLSNLAKNMNDTFNEDNGLNKLLHLSDQVFENQVNWGRIVTLFLFTGILIDNLKKTGKDTYNDKIALWLGICIAKQSNWIRENGNGWQGFIRTLGGAREMQESFFNGLFNITLGLGTVAAALYIQGS